MFREEKPLERIPFQDILTQLVENTQELKRLALHSILVNPTLEGFSRIESRQLQELAKALEKNTTLECIVIDAFPRDGLLWTGEDAKMMGDALQNHPKLNDFIIRLPNIRELTKEAVLGFLSCLQGKAKIEKLELAMEFSPEDSFLSWIEDIGKYLLNTIRIKSLIIKNESSSTHFFNINQNESCGAFITALGQQSHLEILALNNIMLGSNGIAEIESVLCPHYPLKLKVMSFIDCSIIGRMQQSEALVELINHSPQLEQLVLAGNHLGGLSFLKEKNQFIDRLQTITECLPRLPQLRLLDLSGMPMCLYTLKFLVDLVETKQIKLTTLILSGVRISEIDPNLTYIQKLIKNNQQLKKLDISSSRGGWQKGADKISQACFEKLMPLLKNPTECFLEEFYCTVEKEIPARVEVPGDKYPYEKELMTILDANKNICKIDCENPSFIQAPYRYSIDFYMLSVINKSKKYLCEWDTFIQAARTLYAAHYSKEGKNGFKCPSAVIDLMLLFIQPVTPHTNPDSAKNCINLIRFNMRARARANLSCDARQKDLSKNTLCQNRETIKKLWWSQQLAGFATERKPSQFLFFSHDVEPSPRFMRLNQILAKINCYINEAHSGKDSENVDSIFIYINYLSSEKQQRLARIFSYFISFINRHDKNLFLRSMYRGPCSVSITDGKLKITGIKLADLKDFIRCRSQTEQSIGRSCSLM